VSFFGNDVSFDHTIPVIDSEREDVQAVGEQASIFSLVTSGFGNEICFDDEASCGDCGTAG
jgi:hypothetical protein